MKWTDFRNLTDREITLLKRDDPQHREPGFRDVCNLALTKNKKHPLHAESREICAAHLFGMIAGHQLRDAVWNQVPLRELGLSVDAYKALVRKAYSSGSGVMHKGRRLFFY